MATSPLPSQGPTSGWNCYVTPAFSGVPGKGDKIRSGYITPAFLGVPTPAGPREGRGDVATFDFIPTAAAAETRAMQKALLCEAVLPADPPPPRSIPLGIFHGLTRFHRGGGGSIEPQISGVRKRAQLTGIRHHSCMEKRHHFVCGSCLPTMGTPRRKGLCSHFDPPRYLSVAKCSCCVEYRKPVCKVE